MERKTKLKLALEEAVDQAIREVSGKDPETARLLEAFKEAAGDFDQAVMEFAVDAGAVAARCVQLSKERDAAVKKADACEAKIKKLLEQLKHALGD